MKKKYRNLIPLCTFFVGLLIFILFFSQSGNILEKPVTGLGNKLFFSALYTIDAFSYEVDYETIRMFVSPTEYISQNIFLGFVYFLFAVAPVLLVANILTYFRIGIDRLRFFLSKFCGTSYIFSELNQQSIVMASGIYEKKNWWDKIVFADCDMLSMQNMNQKELLKEAYEIHAICLKRELVNIGVFKLFGGNEIFIISGDESKNVSQTIAMINKYKNEKIRNSIYAYISSEKDVELIDAVEKGNYLLDDSFLKRFEVDKSNKDKDFYFELCKMFKDVVDNKNIKIEGTFSVRCITPADQTIYQVIKESYKDLRLKSMETKEKKVSITIVGLGTYGLKFLKTAAWMYQLVGYKVEFHIIDIKKDAEKQLKHTCPEFFYDIAERAADDSSHEVYMHAGIDCFNSEFDEKMHCDEGIKQSHLVFIALGDDDRNIETAMCIRKLVSPENHPLIYAVVRDSQKALDLELGETRGGKQEYKTKGLQNYKGQSYEIYFVGDYLKEYDFANIENVRELEKEAFRYHVNWIKKTLDIREMKENTRVKKGKKISTKNKIKREIAYLVTMSDVKNAARDYAQYSYYRNSSMAMVMHRELLKEFNTMVENDKKIILNKEQKCITEHMRWNAYMRGLGYRYSANRKDIAKLHNCLVPYSELSPIEKAKDIDDFEL